MTNDDALARALAEQARRSKVMADAQRFGAPAARGARKADPQAAARPHRVEQQREVVGHDDQ